MLRRINYEDIDGLLALTTKRWGKKRREKLVQDHKIMNVQRAWPKVAGKSLSTHSFPERIEGDCLFIQVDHSIFAQSVKMLAKNILDKLEKETGIRLKTIRTNVRQNISSLPGGNPEHKKNASAGLVHEKKGDIMSISSRVAQKQGKFEAFIKKIAGLTQKNER